MPPPPTTTRTEDSSGEPRDDPRLARAFAFERAMRGAFGRTVTAAWGQAFLRPDLSHWHDGNLLWAVDDAAGLDAAALDAQAERLLGGAGLPHRRLFVEEPAASRMAPGLAARGYGAARHRFMAFGADAPVPPAPTAPVRVAGVDAVLPGMERYLLTDPETGYGRDATVRAHLLEHSRGFGASVDERAFFVEHDGAPVAWALLWTRDGVAQIDEVVCLAEHRGHGYGRDVVAAATRAARAANADLLFLVADADDWPQHLYARLGFAPIGHLAIHHRTAPATPRAVA